MIYPGIRKRALQVDYDTTPTTDAEKALHLALQARLREIVDKPLSARSLIELEKVANMARSIIIAGKAPGQLMGMQPIFGNSMDDIVDVDSSYAMSSAPPAETFGASAIREFVAMAGTALGKLTEKKESSAAIVTAIAVAREKGMDALAEKLEAKLCGDEHDDKMAENKASWETPVPTSEDISTVQPVAALE